MSNVTHFAVICALISGTMQNSRADDPFQPIANKKEETGQITTPYFWIKNKNSSKYLTVTAERTDSGAPVIQTSEPGPAAVWGLVNSESGYQKIVNRHSNKELSIWNSSNNPGALVEQYEVEKHSAKYHQWQFVGDGQGFFRLVNRGSGMSLGVLGASMEEDQPVVQWPTNKSSDQMWQLILVAIGQRAASIPPSSEGGSEPPQLPPFPAPADSLPDPTSKPTSPKHDSVERLSKSD